MTRKETRKLAAVMFADITGYTAMVQENEAAALAKVDIHRNALKRFTSIHQGEIIAFYGDGSLSTYPSAIDAVKCALEMQAKYLDRDVPVRIGLHLGDIVFKDGTVFGDGVNLASEIESQGIPGSILISSKLQAEVSNHPEITTQSLGFHALKHAARPIELFAITNEGLNVPDGKKQFGKLWRVITRLGILMILIGLLAYLLYDTGILAPDAELKQERIAIRFMDLANIKGKERLADMTSIWLSNRIEEIAGSKVVKFEKASLDPDLVLATAGSSVRKKFARQTGAANLLEGQIFLEGDSLVFDAKIIDLENGNVRQKFGPVKCSATNEMEGVNEITGEIRGWWASKDLKFLSVPTYEAYNSFLMAKAAWLEDRDLAEKNLRSAIAADPDFIDPYFLLLGHLQNEDRYPERDTLLTQIKENFNDMNARQLNLLESAISDASGDLLTTYNKYIVELSNDSLDLFANTQGMVFAMSFVNKPEHAIRFFKMIPIDSLQLNNCGYCTTRLRTAVSAYLALDSVDAALSIIDLFDESLYMNVNRKIQIYTKADDSRSLRLLIENAIRNNISRSNSMWSKAAWQYKLIGNDTGVEEALHSALAPNIENSEYSKMEAYYLLGDYDKISKNIDSWLKAYPGNHYILSYAARVRAHQGDENAIAKMIEALDQANANDQYDYGFYTYYKGVIAAIQGDEENAIDLLEQAYQAGHEFLDIYYQNDIDLMPLFDNPRFDSLIHPTLK